MGTFDLNLPGQFPLIQFLTSFSSFTFRLVNVLLGLEYTRGSNKRGGVGGGVGNFDKIIRKALFVNEIQFYH